MDSGRESSTTYKLSQPHDIIEFFADVKDGIFHKCAPLYEKGHSLKEIKRLTGYGYGTIRQVLLDRGIGLRSSTRSPDFDFRTMRKSGSLSNPPYGFVYIQGQITLNPEEYEVVKMVKSWHGEGSHINEIVSMLNERGLKTRSGKPWYRNLVVNIIKREIAV